MSKFAVEVKHIPVVTEYPIDANELSKIIREEHSGWRDIDLDDAYYYHTDWEGWRKIIEYILPSMPKYIAERFDCDVSPDLAYVMGLFFADGTCSLNKYGNYGGASWNICNTKWRILRRCMTILKKEYPNLDFRIDTFASESQGKETNYCKRNHKLYHLQVGLKERLKFKHRRSKQGDRGRFIEEWRQQFYYHKYKQVPPSIDESPRISQKAFINGVIDGDGYRKQRHIYTYGWMGASGLQALMRGLNWKTYRYAHKTKPGNYTLIYNDKNEFLGKPVPLCDNYARWFSSEVARLFLLNTCATVEGWADMGNGIPQRHKWCVFYDGVHLFQLEPQTGVCMNMNDPLYVPDEIVIG